MNTLIQQFLRQFSTASPWRCAKSKPGVTLFVLGTYGEELWIFTEAFLLKPPHLEVRRVESQQMHQEYPKARTANSYRLESAY